MSPHARGLDVRDEVDGIGGAGVLGQAPIVEIQPARHRLDDDVLENGAETAGGGVDLRLGLRGEPDDFGVASAFKVENAAVGPAMLVIAYELAAPIGRKRGLTRPRKPEEDRRIVARTDIRRAVHRQDALLRQEIIEDREDRLLDLAGIAAATD